MKDENKLIPYFLKYSASLQNVVYKRTGNYFHDNDKRPIQLVYLCPLCLKNKIAILKENLHLDEEFNLDHFPPESVGGKNKVMVCQKCNSTAGTDFDYSLKEWLKDKSAAQWIPGTKIPVKLSMENVKGNYRGNLIVKEPYSFEWDFKDYPLLKEGFENIFKGQQVIQTITFQNPELTLVYKAILKAAYLYCFSVWGYDFVYSKTGHQVREVLLGNVKHILSNWGVFFHMQEPFPPEGLCYVFKPTDLQSFMINFKLTDKETKFECHVSVLIPGADIKCWENLLAYQPIIDTKEKFTNAFIKLPEDALTKDNLFPYTNTWNQRSGFRIFGEP